MHVLKTGLNADKFASYFLDVFEKILSLRIRFANYPYTL